MWPSDYSSSAITAQHVNTYICLDECVFLIQYNAVGILHILVCWSLITPLCVMRYLTTPAP